MRRETLVTLVIVVGCWLAAASALASWLRPDADTAGTLGGPLTSPAERAAATTAPSTTLSHPTHSPARVRHTGQPAATLVPPAEPTAVRIPAIGVDATASPIEAADGLLVPPTDYTTVGWWSDGVMPGSDHGTTLITGHTVHTGGGVLDDLEHVSVGDRVVVERAGADLAYAVASVRTYRKGALAQNAAQLFRQDGPDRLAVVTCEDFNGSVYLSNVVVIATNPQPVPAPATRD